MAAPTSEAKEGPFSALVGGLEEVAAYPVGFSLTQLDSIRSFRERLDYVRNSLGRGLGRGSSRVVFPTSSPNVVLKVALNQKGLAQNRAEEDVSRMFSTSRHVTQVLDSSRDDLWIEAERASPVTQQEFARHSGWPNTEVFAQAVHYHQNGNPNVVSAAAVGLLDSVGSPGSDFLDEILNIVGTFDLDPWDLTPIKQWGRVGSRLVLLDYGFTGDVRDTYYNRGRRVG